MPAQWCRRKDESHKVSLHAFIQEKDEAIEAVHFCPSGYTLHWCTPLGLIIGSCVDPQSQKVIKGAKLLLVESLKVNVRCLADCFLRAFPWKIMKMEIIGAGVKLQP